MNLEATLGTIDSAASAHDMVGVMKQSTNIISKQLSNLNVDDVQQVRDDLSDLTAQSMEITDVLSTQFDLYGDDDEEVQDDIARQIQEWEDEQQQITSNEVEIMLPNAPMRGFVNNNNNNNNSNEKVLN